jgi:hypothetical protein
MSGATTLNQYDESGVKVDLLQFPLFTSEPEAASIILFSESMTVSAQYMYKHLAEANKIMATASAVAKERWLHGFYRLDARLLLGGLELVSRKLLVFTSLWIWSRRVALVTEVVLLVRPHVRNRASQHRLPAGCLLRLPRLGPFASWNPSWATLDRVMPRGAQRGDAVGTQDHARPLGRVRHLVRAVARPLGAWQSAPRSGVSRLLSCVHTLCMCGPGAMRERAFRFARACCACSVAYFSHRTRSYVRRTSQ